MSKMLTCDDGDKLFMVKPILLVMSTTEPEWKQSKITFSIFIK